MTVNDLNPYAYPDQAEVDRLGVQALYFGWFFRWSMLENYRFLNERMDFATHPAGRTPGTFTDFDSLDDKSDNLYYYLQYVKFGFGRAVRDACRMIQNGQMTRPEAVELAHRYDGEFPEEFLDDVLEYLEMERVELEQTIDLHRNRRSGSEMEANGGFGTRSRERGSGQGCVPLRSLRRGRARRGPARARVHGRPARAHLHELWVRLRS